jgi:hypothetical protein
MMVPPKLEFLTPSPLARWWGYGVLALGVAACAAVALHYTQEVASREAVLTQLQPAAKAAPLVAVPVAVQADMTAAQTVTAALSVPWDAWFKALEAVEVPGVFLTALQPEPGSRRARIVGQAHDLALALAYVEQLERSPGFWHVLLLDHALQEGGGPAQVRFTLSAEWEATP